MPDAACLYCQRQREQRSVAGMLRADTLLAPEARAAKARRFAGAARCRHLRHHAMPSKR